VDILIDFPAVIAIVITLPLDQILKSIVPHSIVQDLLNYVLVLAINEHWWQWGVMSMGSGRVADNLTTRNTRWRC
jgi:ABC-type uncharacterized transport system permease subunit